MDLCLDTIRSNLSPKYGTIFILFVSIPNEISEIDSTLHDASTIYDPHPALACSNNAGEHILLSLYTMDLTFYAECSSGQSCELLQRKQTDGQPDHVWDSNVNKYLLPLKIIWGFISCFVIKSHQVG